MSELRQDRNRALMALRINGLDNTEIGRLHGISRERVRQILGNGAEDWLVRGRIRAIRRAIHAADPRTLSDIMDMANGALRDLGARAMAISAFHKCLRVALSEERMTLRQLGSILRERIFWNHVDRRGPEECWPWTIGTDAGGYGLVRLNGLPPSSHRAAWALEHGKIPAGKWILHRCGNASCCNPAHLYAGTAQENAADRSRHGRWVSGKWGKNKMFSEEEIRSARGEFQSGRSIMSIWRSLGKGTYPAAYNMIMKKTYGGVA